MKKWILIKCVEHCLSTPKVYDEKRDAIDDMVEDFCNVTGYNESEDFLKAYDGLKYNALINDESAWYMFEIDRYIDWHIFSIDV